MPRGDEALAGNHKPVESPVGRVLPDVLRTGFSAAALSTLALPPSLAAASKAVLRTVRTLTLSLLCTVAMALPA